MTPAELKEANRLAVQAGTAPDPLVHGKDAYLRVCPNFWRDVLPGLTRRHTAAERREYQEWRDREPHLKEISQHELDQMNHSPSPKP